MRSTRRSMFGVRFFSILTHGDGGSSAITVALMIALIVGAVFLGIGSRQAFGEQAVSPGQQDSPHAFDPNCPHCIPTPAQTMVAWQNELLTVNLSVGSAVLALLVYRRRSPGDAAEPREERSADQVQLPQALFTKRQALLHLLQDNLAAVMESHVRVRHIMSNRLMTVSPETPADEVRQLMRTKKIRHLLVCAGTKLVGIISDRDIKARNGRKAADIMTRDPASVSSDTEASPAVTVLINNSISCVPVVDNGDLVGILTTTDIMLALQCMMQLLERVGHDIRATPQCPTAPSAEQKSELAAV